MKLELYEHVYQRLVDHVKQMHDREDLASPSEKELTTTLNQIVESYLGKGETSPEKLGELYFSE